MTGKPFIYLAFALICAVLHNAIVIGADIVGIHYVAGNVISYGIVVVVGYALHTIFTFRQPASTEAFARYAAAMATNYPGSIALMFLLCDVAMLPAAIACPIATVCLFIWNFAMSRWAIMARTALGRAN